MNRSVVAAAAALLLFALSASADPGEFDPLIEKKGPSVGEVLYKPTLYRVAELSALPATREEFEFLLDRPRLSLAMARLIDPGMDRYRIEVRPDGSYFVHDKGLEGYMELVHKGGGRRFYYIAGHWDFMLGLSFKGRMVLLQEYLERGPRSARAVDTRTRGFMRIDNPIMGVIAKVVVYLFPKKVDARIARFEAAVRKVTVAVHDDPEGVARRIAASGEAPPAELDEYRAMFCGRQRPSPPAPLP